MRVLVTGASGLIGSALAQALIGHGQQVVGLSRNPERARDAQPAVAWHAWDPARERPPAEAFEGVEAVVNLVGEPINQRLTPAAKERIHASRVRATKNLVAGMLAARPAPAVLVSQSATGLYGDRGAAVVEETTPPASDWIGRLVVEWEAAAREASAHDIRVAILRTGLVLDPRGGLLKQLLLPFRLGLGGPLAGGDQYMPWIHRDDELGMIQWALTNDRVSGELNATAPNPVANRDFSKALGRVLRRPALIPAPKLAVTALRGSELADQVAASLRVVPRRALDLGYSFRFTELEPALRDLLTG